MVELGLEPESNRLLCFSRVVVLRLLIMVDLELMQERTPSIPCCHTGPPSNFHVITCYWSAGLPQLNWMFQSTYDAGMPNLKSHCQMKLVGFECKHLFSGDGLQPWTSSTPLYRPHSGGVSVWNLCYSFQNMDHEKNACVVAYVAIPEIWKLLRLSVCLSVCLSVRLSVCQSVCLSVFLSIHIFSNMRLRTWSWTTVYWDLFTYLQSPLHVIKVMCLCQVRRPA